MRLLHIIASVDPAGGGPIEGLLRQAEATAALARREIACLDPPEAPWLREHPVPVHALGARRARCQPLRRWAYAPDFQPWLHDRLAGYDAAVVHGLWNHAAFAAGRVLPRGGTPYVVFPHGMLDPWFRRSQPLKHAAKLVSWTLAEGPLLAGARAVLFTSEEERRRARGVFPGHAYVERIVSYGAASPPPADPAQAAAFRAAAPGLGERPYLLFLGRIHPKKGCDLLLRAFAAASREQPGPDLVIAGPDPDGRRAALEALAQDLGVAARVHWPGPLYGPAKWGALRGAEAFVLVSHQENFAIAVAEALACGRPVLLSNQVNIWREIEAAGAGLVAPDTTPGATALLRAWARTPEARRRAMSATAGALFADRFDMARAAPAALRTIRAAVSGGAGR